MKDKTSQIEDSEYIEVKRVLGSENTGDHILMQDQATGALMMKKLFRINDKERARATREKYEKRLSSGNPYVIDCLDFSFLTKSQLCVKYFQLAVYYEYPLYDLEKLFKARMNENRYFYHEELMFIFYHALEGLCHFSEQSKGHGYLQFNMVFYDTERQRYKLCENFGHVPLYEQYVTSFFSNNGYKVFAPEMLENMQANKRESINMAKLDVFNLGVLLLCLGTLSKPLELYDVSYYRLSSFGMEKLLAEFNDRYESKNPLLVEIVKELLILSPLKRATPIEIRARFPSLAQFLEVYEQNKSKADRNSPTVSETVMNSFIKDHQSLKVITQAENRIISVKGKSFFDI